MWSMNYIYAGAISFSSIILLVLLICVVVYWIPDKYTTQDTIELSEIAKHGKTFDLLGVSYKSLSCAFVKMFTNSKWSHLAMLYRPSAPAVSQGNELYVIEIIRTKRSKTDIQCLTFEQWCKRNESYPKLFLRSRKNMTSSQETILKQLVQGHIDKKTPVNMNLFDWIQTLKKTPFDDTNKRRAKTSEQKNYFCTEFIVMLLQEVKLLEKQHRPSNYTPVELLFPKMFNTFSRGLYDQTPKRIL